MSNQTIKIEVGKHYELNSGAVHKCTSMRDVDPFAFGVSGYGPFIIDGMCYHQDGRFGTEDAEYKLSVKREVPAPDTNPAKHTNKPDVTITISWAGNGAYIDVGDRNGFADSVQCVWMDGVGVTLASVVSHALDDVVNQLEAGEA